MLVRVVGVVVNQGTIQLFIEGGKPYRVPAEAWRVAVVKEKLVPALTKHQVVEFDVETFELERRFQDLTGGRIRLGWEKVRSFLGFKVDRTQTTVARDVKILEGLTEAPDAQPLPTEKTRGDYSHTYGVDRDPDADHMVATVGDKRIPGVENLKPHMEHAVSTGNTKGMEAFLSRIAGVIETRQHSIDELLHFMSKADLPIADDGCIIAYKVLKRSGDHYVDCHSKKVPQRPGSLVMMDEARVDPSRRHECSSGFHIARRGYIGSFSGDVCVLVKIAPEDVIAVPYNEPNKMRVAKYHIIFELPIEGYRLLKANRPMTQDARSAQMLAAAIAGNHMEPIEMVMQTNDGIEITPLENGKPAPKRTKAKAHALDDTTAIKPVDEINKAAEAAKAEEEVPDLEEEEPTCSECGEVSDIDPCESCEEELLEDLAEEDAEQDREGYTDDQDRDGYTAEPEPEPEAVVYTPPAELKEEYDKLSDDQKKALQLRAEGKSQRVIQDETSVSRKSQWRLAQKGF